MVFLGIGLVVIGLGLLLFGNRIKIANGDIPIITQKSIPSSGFIAMGAGLVLLVVSSVQTIPAGQVGIPVLFGKVQDNHLEEGLNFINPFMTVVITSVRTDVYTMQGQRNAITALSSDGLRMPMEISVIYRLVASDAPWVYRNLGSDYVGKIIVPASRTAVREAAAEFISQEAYSTRREELADRILEILQARLKKLLSEQGFQSVGIIIQEVLLRNVDLPERLRVSIEEKLSAEQEAQRMQFVLDKERQEADRKSIEAKGIADFQRIITKSINADLLKWKGIEATIELAKSQNAKVVVIGSSKDGLPLILGGQ